MEQHCTLCVLLFIATLTLGHCQSGDGGDWGSGSMPELLFTSTSTPIPNTVYNDSPNPESTNWTKSLFQVIPDSKADGCSVNFHTSQAMSRRLQVAKEEMAYLKALQHGNQAVMENLIQFVGAEMGDQSYQDIIQENIVAIKEDHASCVGVLRKATEELENQLEGAGLAGIQRITEDSLTFERMLRVTTDIANQLETSSRTLHLQITEQLRKGLKLKRT
ncbi:uncharacterized protein si:ch211-142k18.1 [Silurus meridionalis]|uniref:Uncharacterized protein n=1 Tax=Silurus meridionalis TaxID=175797 RepID=A0A8T0AFF4_SILME|nr:uncharacterized protein si:ch211-142k18.1 [Silurus meridionalis]KAF7690245.1 hypothetical protein HF521_012049 [Silurus meridionalis]